MVHVGLPKTGTTYLQGLLAGQRDRLRAGSVVYPFVRPGGLFEGAVEVRGSAALFGLDPGRLAGTWQALCDRARAFLEETGGTAILGHEVLGGATPDQVARALAPLVGLEVHVVVTARDLGRQAVAHWQERIKLGEDRSFAQFEREELVADTGRDLGPDAGGRRPRFWHAQDYADTLRRWTAGLEPSRGHLVVCPPPGAPRAALWERFAAGCGVPPGLVDPEQPVRANASLGVAEIALLRAVNRALGGRLSAGDYARLVKRPYAEGELAARPGSPAPRTPARLEPLLAGVTRHWVEEVRRAGHVVHGDVVDLTPVVAGPGDPDPDGPPPPGIDPDAVVERLLSGGFSTGGTIGSAPEPEAR